MAVASICVIAAVVWFVRDVGPAIKAFFGGDDAGVTTTVPPSATSRGLPPEAEPVPTVEDRLTLRERLTPGRAKTRAEELTAGLPGGTEVYEVKTAEGEQVGLIYRTPKGEIYKEGELQVGAYRAPTPLVAVEFRPHFGGGLGLGGGTAVAGVDVVRVWRVHLGPGVAVDYPAKNVAAVGTAGIKLWRNVDLRLAGGYGTKGAAAAAGLSLAIE
ncbi:MAG: hypothetical protein V3W11_03385 [bacterium]